MANPNIIMVHGNGGLTAEDIWFPETATRLRALGLEVIARTMPDNMQARSHIWLPFLYDTLRADENSIIIGHSSGAVAAMRYAETHRVFGSVLVSAMHTDQGMYMEKLSGYYKKPWDWGAIKANQNWITQFASTDDPYIPIQEPRDIHAELDSDYHEETDRGHFTDPIFPELVSVIAEKLGL